MNYDKNSFLSGVVIGRQLRGWDHAKRDILVSPWIENAPAERNDPKHGTVTWSVSRVYVDPAPGEDTVPPDVYLEEYVSQLLLVSGWQSLGVGPNAPYGDGNYGVLLSTNIDGVTVEIFNTNYESKILGYINEKQAHASFGGGWLRYRNGYTAHVAYYSGLDWEAFQFLSPSLAGSYGSATGMLTLVVTDYFRPDRKLLFLGRVGKFAQPLEGTLNNRFATLYSSGTSAVAHSKIIRPYNAIKSPLIEVAAPINFYAPASTPFYDGIRGISGFVGGMNNLYNITKGSDIRDTGDVDNRLSVGGVQFAGGGGTYGTAIRLS